MMLSFNLYALSNLILSFSLSQQQKVFCVAPSKPKLNYSFKSYSTALPPKKVSHMLKQELLRGHFLALELHSELRSATLDPK